MAHSSNRTAFELLGDSVDHCRFLQQHAQADSTKRVYIGRMRVCIKAAYPRLRANQGAARNAGLSESDCTAIYVGMVAKIHSSIDTIS